MLTDMLRNKPYLLSKGQGNPINQIDINHVHLTPSFCIQELLIPLRVNSSRNFICSRKSFLACAWFAIKASISVHPRLDKTTPKDFQHLCQGLP